MESYDHLVQIAEKRKYAFPSNNRDDWFSSGAGKESGNEWDELTEIYKGEQKDYLFEVKIQCDHRSNGGKMVPLEIQNLTFFSSEQIKLCNEKRPVESKRSFI